MHWLNCSIKCAELYIEEEEQKRGPQECLEKERREDSHGRKKKERKESKLCLYMRKFHTSVKKPTATECIVQNRGVQRTVASNKAIQPFPQGCVLWTPRHQLSFFWTLNEAQLVYLLGCRIFRTEEIQFLFFKVQLLLSQPVNALIICNWYYCNISCGISFISYS